MKHFIVRYVLFLSLSILASSVNCKAQDRDPFLSPEFKRNIIDRLNLNHDQLKQIEPLKAARRQVFGLFSQLKVERIKLNELLRNDSASEDEVIKQIGLINSLLSEINLKRVKNLISLKQILTPSQRVILNEIITERMENIRKNSPRDKRR